MSMENVKKVVEFGLDVGAALIAASGASSPLGKAAAMLQLVEDVPMLMGVDYKALEGEVLALGPEQLDELEALIDSKVSLPDADKQAKVLAAVSVVIELAKVVEKAVAMWHAKPVAVAAVAEVAVEAPAPAAP